MFNDTLAILDGDCSWLSRSLADVHQQGGLVAIAGHIVVLQTERGCELDPNLELVGWDVHNLADGGPQLVGRLGQLPIGNDDPLVGAVWELDVAVDVATRRVQRIWIRLGLWFRCHGSGEGPVWRSSGTGRTVRAKTAEDARKVLPWLDLTTFVCTRTHKNTQTNRQTP